MAYLASVHKASSVRSALRTNFLVEEEQSLVVAKSNRIEVYTFSGEGLNLRTSFTVYGRISGVLDIHPANSPTSHLVIVTDSLDYFTVSWDAERGTIRNERAAHDVSDKFLRDARCGALYRADPEGRLLGFHAYEGSFLAIPVTTPGKKVTKKKGEPPLPVGDLENPAAIRMNELKVVDVAFLHGEDTPVLGVLHRDGNPDFTQLVTYKVVTSAGNGEFEKFSLDGTDLDGEAKFLIPIAEPMGGVIVVGEQLITYIGKTRSFKYALAEAVIFHSWGQVDRQRFLLGDELGQLKVLLLEVKDDEVVGIKVEVVGKTAQASCIVYLDNGHVFIGSHYGDSQLVKLSPHDPKCQVLQSFPNLAPILDFQVMDSAQKDNTPGQASLHSSGQARIVTASGGFRDGGLRSMKSGVGLEDLAVLGEMEGVRSLWVLRTNPASVHDDHLVISFIDETRVFAFDPDGEVEELEEFNSLKLDEETLAAQNVPGGRIIQVTKSGAILIDTEGGTVVATATPEGLISSASITDHFLICTVAGKSVVCFDISQDLREAGRATFEHEVACIYASEYGVAAVGFWTTSSVSLLSLPDLVTQSEEVLNVGKDQISVPRSIMIANVVTGHPPTMLVAMGDGTLYTFSLDIRKFSLSEGKAVTLGTQVFYFCKVPRENDTFSIFAACDYPNLIYGDDGRLMYSAVTADHVTQLQAFNTAAFPSAVAVMVGNELKISTVDTTRTIHVKTLFIGDVVRRVVYSHEHQLFALATVHTEVDDEGIETFKCHIRTVDNESFTVVDSFDLQPNELVESLDCHRFAYGDDPLNTNEKFILGTGFQDEDSDECKKGRIVVFEVSHNRRLRLAAEHEVKSAVKCIAGYDSDKILATMNKTIEIFSFRYPVSITKPEIKSLCLYRAHSEPIGLALGSKGTPIAIGDLMKGPSIIEYKLDSEGNPTLSEVARSYETSWTTAVGTWDEDTIISADADGNIQLMQQNKSGIAEDQKRLQVVGEMRLGEMVNRFRTIDAKALPDAPVVPKSYLGTVDGSIYLLGQILESRIKLLLQLQSNLAKVVKGVGEQEFSNFRAFSSSVRVSDEPYRIVDGDFIERFLELPEDVAEKVVNGVDVATDALEIGVEELRVLVEGLKRLH